MPSLVYGARTMHLLMAHALDFCCCNLHISKRKPWQCGLRDWLAPCRTCIKGWHWTFGIGADRSDSLPYLVTILKFGKTTAFSPDMNGNNMEQLHSTHNMFRNMSWLGNACQLSNDSRLSSIWARRTAERYPSRRHMSSCDKLWQAWSATHRNRPLCAQWCWMII